MATNEKLMERIEYRNTEFQLLGILLQYPEKIDEVADSLETKHFLDPQAQLIYDILLAQYQESNQISRTKLFLKLKKDGIIKNPEEMIERLTSGFNTVDELEPTIDIIKLNYQRHLISKAAERLQHLVDKTDLNIDDYQARAQEIIFEATNENSSQQKHIYDMEEALLVSYEGYLARKSKEGDLGLH